MHAVRQVTYPLDTLRLRLAVDPAARSLRGASRVLFQEGSYQAYFRGLGPSLIGKSAATDFGPRQVDAARRCQLCVGTGADTPRLACLLSELVMTVDCQGCHVRMSWAQLDSVSKVLHIAVHESIDGATADWMDFVRGPAFSQPWDSTRADM